MSGLFGSGAAEREAKRSAAAAREQQQDANEETMRAQQQAERGGRKRANGETTGVMGSKRPGRTLMLGNLGAALNAKLGG